VGMPWRCQPGSAPTRQETVPPREEAMYEAQDCTEGPEEHHGGEGGSGYKHKREESEMNKLHGAEMQVS